MSIIADRGLFVRLLVQSGRFDAPGAESFADAMDAATLQPATKADVSELRTDFVPLDQRFNLLEKGLDARFSAHDRRLLVRLGGLMFVLLGLLFAALRLT